MLSKKDEEKAKALLSTIRSLIFVLCFVLIVGVITLKDTTTSKWTVCYATTGETAEALSHKGDAPQIAFTYVVDGTTYSQLVKESSLHENKNYGRESLKLGTTAAAKSAYVEYEKPHSAHFTVEDLHQQALESEKS